MSGEVLVVDHILAKDALACKIAIKYQEWESYRVNWKDLVEETRRFIFATDTTQTTVSKTPWKNKTTLPKLCQIRDNLYANYTATLFPQRKWVVWEAGAPEENNGAKKEAIEAYMQWVLSQPDFKREMDKCILDYIDYGNCFATVEFSDSRIELPNKTQVGYVGPKLKRISPLDIVFNPIAESFEKTPKIIRSLISIGELKKMLESLTKTERSNDAQALYDYLLEIRSHVANFRGEVQQKDNLFNVDGFTSFKNYLESDFVEVLTFYGDLYEKETKNFYQNHIITVVDRHKIISNIPNPSSFGQPPIWHVGWRRRQDNLWAMGPLDNLVGMQYRIDHLENAKADVWDLFNFPVTKVKGSGVEEFEWGPNERIYMDTDSDVELERPEIGALQANNDVQYLMSIMEEMAGAPKEAVGFRTPGEKTKYEFQQLQNAAARVFQNKINQFSEHFVEKVLNGLLEEGKRNTTSAFTIGITDSEFKIQTFQELTVEDITGVGTIRPVAAKHFAEQADLVQNLTNLSTSGLFPLVQPHMSGIALSNTFDYIFNTQDYGIFAPYVGISEQAQAQKFASISQENAMTAAATPSGLTPDDYSNAPSVDKTPQR